MNQGVENKETTFPNIHEIDFHQVLTLLHHTVEGSVKALLSMRKCPSGFQNPAIDDFAGVQAALGRLNPRS